MKHVARKALLGLLFAIALSLTTGETLTATDLNPAVVVAVSPVVAPAVNVPAAGTIYCLYCGRYEGFAVNPSTLEWEEVIYAYCEEWQVTESLNGGAWFCLEPPNNWNLDDEWEGDVCEMQPHNNGQHYCNCSFEPLMPWPGEPLTIQNCEPNESARSVAADGFVVRAQSKERGEASPLQETTTCNGIVTGVAISAASANLLGRASNLII